LSFIIGNGVRSVAELLAPCVLPSVIVQGVHNAKHGALTGHLDGLSK